MIGIVSERDKQTKYQTNLLVHLLVSVLMVAL